METTPPGSHNVSRSERGSSMVETLVVLGLAGLLIGVSSNYSVNSIGREEVRSAMNEIQTHMQLARSEAIKRNRVCRFTVNTATRVLQVSDLNGTSTTTDDVVLQSTTLSRRVSFERPGGGAAVTLPVLSGTTYQLDFGSNGAVSGSAGTVCARGGDRFDQVTASGGGATRIDRWNGTAWVTGS